MFLSGNDIKFGAFMLPAFTKRKIKISEILVIKFCIYFYFWNLHLFRQEGIQKFDHFGIKQKIELLKTFDNANGFYYKTFRSMCFTKQLISEILLELSYKSKLSVNKYENIGLFLSTYPHYRFSPPISLHLYGMDINSRGWVMVKWILY